MPSLVGSEMCIRDSDCFLCCCLVSTVFLTPNFLFFRKVEPHFHNGIFLKCGRSLYNNNSTLVLARMMPCEVVQSFFSACGRPALISACLFAHEKTDVLEASTCRETTTRAPDNYIRTWSYLVPGTYEYGFPKHYILSLIMSLWILDLGASTHRPLLVWRTHFQRGAEKETWRGMGHMCWACAVAALTPST